MNPKKWISVILIISLLILVPTVTMAENSDTSGNKDNEVMKVNIQEAVKIGLENTWVLKGVSNEIALSKLYDEQAEYSGRKLRKGKDKIDAAEKALAEAKAQYPGMDFSSQENSINNADSTLISASQTAGNTIAGKLGAIDFPYISAEDAADLMTATASTNYNVTKASYDIYKNQLSMLIQKDYYDVLKMRKMAEAKEKAMERGKKQYEFAQNGFEAGMESKDNMLLANTYYQGTQIEYRNAVGDFNNAVIELKKNMNVPLDTQLELTDVLEDKLETADIQTGLKSGMQNRLEMKKAIGEFYVYTTNFEVVKSEYPDNTFKYREAELLKEKSNISLQQTKVDVESSIRQSYETLKTTGEMLEQAKPMLEQAKQSVEIAGNKYKEGYGTQNALLKKLDIEDTAGTVMEVVAAEENLAQVEESIIEIIYGYNLAKAKYNNDCGILLY